MSIVLSKRMKAILDCVPSGLSLADIGTDHAFIPISAIHAERVQRAIATDLRTGPLDKARENVAVHGLQDVVELRLGNGLQPLQVGEVNVIVSAGIGGHVHAEMLKTSPAIAKSAKTIIFQPMNAGFTLRQRLDEDGFGIVTESVVMDDQRIYEIIVASYEHVTDAYAHYRDHPLWMKLAYTYGPHLLCNPSELTLLRLHQEWDKRNRALDSVQQSSAHDAKIRANHLQHEMEGISFALKAIGGTNR